MSHLSEKPLPAALGLLLVIGTVTAGEWYEKISIKGDLRHRFEWYGKEFYVTDTAGNDVLQDTLATPRYRNRVRGRLEVKAKPEDNLEIGMRLVTGGSDPVSTNQTFDGAFTSKGFMLDRAYFSWTIVDGLWLKGGKYGVPWQLASGAFWDGDLAVEGATVGWDGEFGSVSPFVNLNYLWVDEIKSDPADVMLYLGQGGANFAFGNVKLLFAVNYFTYTNIVDHGPFYDDDFFGNTEGEELVIDTSFVVDTLSGDTTWAYDSSMVGTGGYAYGYDVLQPSCKLGFKVGNFPVSIYADLVYNINSEVTEDNMGYMFGIKLGKAKNPGSFEVSANYGALQADCANTLGPDSDTPRKYYRFQGDLAMKF